MKNDPHSEGSSSHDVTGAIDASVSIEKRRRAVALSLAHVRRDPSPAQIHRLRVVTRRLLAAIDVLHDVINESLAERSRKSLRRMLHRLGRLRDIHVQRQTLTRIRTRATLPESAAAGLERLDLRLSQQQDKRQAKLPKTLRRFDESKTLTRLARWTRRQRDHQADAVDSLADATDAANPLPSAAESAGARTSPNLTGVSAQSIRRALALLTTLLDLAPAVTASASPAESHHMRIAAKKLRYFAEVLVELGLTDLTNAISVLKQLQRLLGQVHDADVWTVNLPIFMEKERRRTRRYFGDDTAIESLQAGVTWMTEHRQRIRQRQHKQFVATWTQALADGRWEHAREVLEQHVGSASDDSPQTTHRSGGDDA